MWNFCVGEFHVRVCVHCVQTKWESGFVWFENSNADCLQKAHIARMRPLLLMKEEKSTVSIHFCCHRCQLMLCRLRHTICELDRFAMNLCICVIHHTQRELQCRRHISACSAMAIVMVSDSITCTGNFCLFSFWSFVRRIFLFCVCFDLSKYLVDNQLGKYLFAWNVFCFQLYLTTTKQSKDKLSLIACRNFNGSRRRRERE